MTDGDGKGAAVVFVSHTLHDSVISRFEKLEREILPANDLYFAYDATGVTPEERRRARDAVGERLWTFETTDVTAMEYPNPWADPTQQELVPGNLGLLYLSFSRARTEYARYWFIEYDVAYTGLWSSFFKALEESGADVLGSTLRPYADKPHWHWWLSLEPVPDLEHSELLRGFFPVARLSQQALDALDDGYRAGWSGHFEAVIPTLARHRGLELEDFGGDGPYVRPKNRNRFYTNSPEEEFLSPGTFVYRPVRPRPGILSGKLWHPVKPNQGLLAYARPLKRWIEYRILDR